MSDHEWEGIGLYQAIINIIAASTSAALGVLKLTGGTMSGVIAMGANKITGMTTGSATGEAITWDSLLQSIPRNSYSYASWTADTPTNVTEVLTTGANGPTIRLTFATATSRLGGRYTAGTRITIVPRGSARGPVSGTAGEACYIAQADANRRLGFATGIPNGLYVLLFTNKDTFSAIRAQVTLAPQGGVAPARRIASQGGNVTAELSSDGGASWEALYGPTADATAFGAAGAGTLTGHGGYSAENGAVVNAYAPYALVEA